MTALGDARQNRDTAQRQLTELTAQLAAASRLGDHQAIATLTAQRDAAAQRAATAAQQVDSLRQAALAAAPDPVAGIDAALPIALLPVRIETRFSGTDLLIRVYPDDIHIDTHEPELTVDESARGSTYWQQVAAGADTRDAWRQLARFHGPQRGEWIARSTQETATTPPARAGSWTRAARTDVLPDRWVALGYTAGGRVFAQSGAPIPDRLTTGPAPDDGTRPPPPGGTDALAQIAPEMNWLFDFEAAVTAGMALRVPLPQAAQAGLTRLIVFGVKTTMDGAESARALAGLLAAHRYTNGLALLERGTPTNNTRDAPSGYTSVVSVDDDGPFVRPTGGAAGDALSRALGIDAGAFANAIGVDDPAETVARAVSTALWPPTWGYYLAQRLPGIVSDSELACIRSHFIDHVRGAGALSALRVGKQPYGMLPVTALDLWAPADGGDVTTRAVTVLRNLGDAYARAVVNVPRLSGAADPDQSLLEILHMDAYSSSHAVRHMVGPRYVDNFFSFAGTPLDAAWWRAQAAVATLTVNIPGLPANSPQATSLFAPTAISLGDKPLVQAANGDLAYLRALAAANLTTLRANTTVAPGARTVFYDLARHALLLGYAADADRIQRDAGMAADGHEPELVDITGPPTATVWRRLDQPVAAVTGTQALGDYLDAAGHAAAVDELRVALNTLADQPAERLELHVAAALDTASHRWDAWATSVANRRLETLRATRPTGIRVGGYGWVDNLTPATAQPSAGYIHTPSPTHATTAAILASGYLTHRTSNSGNPFAIDLSAERVKLADRLFAGVRRGQPLPALLGYELERALHDAGLSSYVARFRSIAPLLSNASAGTAPSEAVAATNVVHGEKVLTMWQNNAPAFAALRTPANTADFTKIDAIFTRLADLVDALGDVLTANSVYQVARGNFNRAGLTLDAVLRGEPLPPQEVITTSRTGTGLLHRVIEFLDIPSVAPSTWPTNAMQARAVADPSLNAWAAARLPEAHTVTCTGTAAGTTTRTVSLAELELSPLDAVYTDEPELRARFAHLAGTNPAQIDFTATAGGAVSVENFLAITAALRATLAGARPLTGADLSGPDSPAEPGIDIDELHARTEAAIAKLRALHDTAAAGDAAALMRAAHLGLPAAVPAAGRQAQQLAAVEADTAHRLAAVDGLAQAFDAASAIPAAILDYERDRMRAVFGADFQVLPRFTAANSAELQTAFGASDALLGNRRLEAHSWFTRVSCARDAMGPLADTLRFAEAFTTAVPTFTVGQLPYTPGEPWIALPLRPNTQRTAHLSLFAVGSPPQLDQPVTGLVFDEWNEVIPNPSETTGLTFHAERPTARSPHAILLAVAPDTSQPWNLARLEQVLRETIALSQARLVDQDAMTELDQFLPAAAVAVNAGGDTISSDLRVR
ncbi:MAG: hypothetical protein ACXVYI_00110 [Mycobacterium sp.]